MSSHKTAQAPEDSSTRPSYTSFPPFKATPLLHTISPPNLSIVTSSNNPSTSSNKAPSSNSSTDTPPDTPAPRPQMIVDDPLYYDRFSACVYFGKCGGWVTVRGTACAACVKGKAGGVLDRLREAAQGDR